MSELAMRTLCLIAMLLVSMGAISNGALANSLCLPPAEPFVEKLSRNDVLYEAARAEHQRYLEDTETYLNCLDKERRRAFGELQRSYQLFRRNFGDDAVFLYQECQRHRVIAAGQSC